MEISKKEVGARIKKIRQMLNLSMEKFGDLLGDIPRSTVNNWERGINLPRPETLNRIAEVGDSTNEYILYGEKENQYILDLLRKKAGKIDPIIEQAVHREIKNLEPENEQQLSRMITIFTDNLVPPSDEDFYDFKLIDKMKQLYLCSNHFGEAAKLFLHYDTENEMLHLMPFTFAEPSVSRVLIFLTNKESIRFFNKSLDKSMKELPIAIYITDEDTHKLKLYPLIFSKSHGAYQIEIDNLKFFKGKLYFPFIEEITKQTVFEESLSE